MLTIRRHSQATRRVPASRGWLRGWNICWTTVFEAAGIAIFILIGWGVLALVDDLFQSIQ